MARSAKVSSLRSNQNLSQDNSFKYDDLIESLKKGSKIVDSAPILSLNSFNDFSFSTDSNEMDTLFSSEFDLFQKRQPSEIMSSESNAKAPERKTSTSSIFTKAFDLLQNISHE
jgi:hypothetical protein